MKLFEPNRKSALARLAAVQPAAYARSRNALDGAVTRLSPYLTHGLLSLQEVYAAVNARHPLHAQHKLVFELGWRAYYRHVWLHLGDGIHQSLRAGLLPDDAYQSEIPADVMQARTGICAIDLAVRELYDTGYLHNHARMWLASYLVHLRKVHWHTGAQWMLGHLLDGDIASNHLSWQWVAGTGSSKPYLFNADNVAKYAPAPWHSPGTVIDTSYETLHGYAQAASAVHRDTEGLGAVEGIEPTVLQNTPLGTSWAHPDSAVVAGHDVWLHHPWSLGAPLPQSITTGVSVGIGLVECHPHTPWNARRWKFVRDGMLAHTPHVWWGNVQKLVSSLRNARSVQWQSDPHVNAAMAQVQHLLRLEQGAVTSPQHQPCLFAPVESYCQSFSQWWRQTRVVPPAE